MSQDGHDVADRGEQNDEGSENLPEWINDFADLSEGDVFSADIDESETGYEGTTITAVHVNTDVPNHRVTVEISDDDAHEHGYPISEGRYGGLIYGPYSFDDESGDFTLELPPVSDDYGERTVHRLSGFEYRPSMEAGDLIENWGGAGNDDSDEWTTRSVLDT